MKKIRLDEYLVMNGISDSIETARKEILTGWIKINDETIRSPDLKISNTEYIKKEKPGNRFVSRGGEKLNHALDYFNISVKDKTAIDIGSSTGGFTDCLLQSGAKKVYSIDVGYGILDYNLRNDKRVIVKERTNFRNIEKSEFNDKIDFICCDVSFISILKLFDKIKNYFSPVQGIILIKPQFEAEPDEHIKGVVKNKDTHRKIITRVIKSLLDKGMILEGLHFSPLKGPKGNIEFLLYFKTKEKNCNKTGKNIEKIIDTVLDEAYNYKFNKK